MNDIELEILEEVKKMLSDYKNYPSDKQRYMAIGAYIEKSLIKTSKE